MDFGYNVGNGTKTWANSTSKVRFTVIEGIVMEEDKDKQKPWPDNPAEYY